MKEKKRKHTDSQPDGQPHTQAIRKQDMWAEVHAGKKHIGWQGDAEAGRQRD